LKPKGKWNRETIAEGNKDSSNDLARSEKQKAALSPVRDYRLSKQYRMMMVVV